jgi:5-methyltetrahydrofolate--homocysteine methyltransferase
MGLFDAQLWIPAQPDRHHHRALATGLGTRWTNTGKASAAMDSILNALAAGQVIVGDGAMGTQLQACGLPAGTMPELWNAEHPEVLRAIHRDYLGAGARIATTNTFGGTRTRLAGAGLADRLVELNRKGVELARAAVDGRAWVAGDVGPTGQLLEPYGDLAVADAEAIYREQVTVLAEAGADLILIETMNDIEEALCAVRMAREHTSLPVFCTFAFNVRGRTMMGLRPGDAARRAADAGAHAVGANCGEGPAAVLAGLSGMREAIDLPLIAQSNAGIPQMGAGGTTAWDVTPEQMAAHARAFVEAGAQIVGGCCGTGPAHIAAISAAIAPALT